MGFGLPRLGRCFIHKENTFIMEDEITLIQITEKRYLELIRLEGLATKLKKSLHLIIQDEIVKKAGPTTESAKEVVNAFCIAYNISYHELN
jgi:hypothetical protein